MCLLKQEGSKNRARVFKNQTLPALTEAFSFLFWKNPIFFAGLVTAGSGYPKKAFAGGNWFLKWLIN